MYYCSMYLPIELVNIEMIYHKLVGNIKTYCKKSVLFIYIDRSLNVLSNNKFMQLFNYTCKKTKRHELLT